MHSTWPVTNSHLAPEHTLSEGIDQLIVLPSTYTAIQTNRRGGCSAAPYTSFNLALHVNDQASDVAQNRQRLEQHLPEPPLWLKQVHGLRVIAGKNWQAEVAADGMWTTSANQVCAIQTADCVPILFWGLQRTVVAACHAGWRGLAKGIIANTLSQLTCPASDVAAWVGPCIGFDCFEIGAEVYAQLNAVASEPGLFRRHPQQNDKWYANLAGLALWQLQQHGVGQIYAANDCTYTRIDRYFSHRRDHGQTGRMASMIWINAS